MKDRAAAMTMIEKLNLCSVQDAKVQMAMADRKINAVISTSAGRLFDGVSAILGIGRLQHLKAGHPWHWNLQRKRMKKHQNAVDLQHAMDEMRKQFPLAACIDNKESESTEINKPEQVKAVLNSGAGENHCGSQTCRRRYRKTGLFLPLDTGRRNNSGLPKAGKRKRTGYKH